MKSVEAVALNRWAMPYEHGLLKDLPETRPIIHKYQATITGHIFVSFLALVLLHELDRRLDG